MSVISGVLSVPGGVFTQAGAGVKTNILFFTKGEPTSTIWYYDLSDLKIRKRTPLTIQHFDEFFQRLPTQADSDLSWTVDRTRDSGAAKEAAPFRAERQVSLMKFATEKGACWSWKTKLTQVDEYGQIKGRDCYIYEGRSDLCVIVPKLLRMLFMI
ncbi:MAG: N-6 DNA methylase [Caldilineaceae bacterium]